MNLGIIGLEIQVLQEKQLATGLRKVGRSLEPLDRRTAAGLQFGREVEAGVDRDPLGADPPAQIDVGGEILVGRLPEARRELRYVHRGKSVNADMDAVPVAGLAHGADPRVSPVV